VEESWDVDDEVEVETEDDVVDIVVGGDVTVEGEAELELEDVVRISKTSENTIVEAPFNFKVIMEFVSFRKAAGALALANEPALV
jgi:hypothetical protein